MPDSSKTRVLAWPKAYNRGDNPYNFLYYRQLEQLGVPVAEYRPGNALRVWDYDLLHIHWPESILNQTWLACLRRFSFFLVLMLWTRIWRRAVVWTVHDYWPHESRRPVFARLLSVLLYWRVDGFLCLNQANAEAVRARLLRPAKQRCTVIPHQHYRGYYPSGATRAEARQRFGIVEDAFVFLFLGLIRPYKNLSGLVRAFSALDRRHGDVLLVAGDARFGGEVETQDLERTAGAVWHPGFVPQEDLQWYFAAADLYVTPYLRVSNSGALILSLGFGTPVLGPAGGVFDEVRESVGDDWVMTYRGALSADVLKNARSRLRVRTDAAEPNLEALEPERVARQSLSFYRQVLQTVRTTKK